MNYGYGLQTTAAPDSYEPLAELQKFKFEKKKTTLHFECAYAHFSGILDKII